MSLSPINHCLAFHNVLLGTPYLSPYKITDYVFLNNTDSFSFDNLSNHPELACLNAAEMTDILKMVQNATKQYGTNCSYGSEACKFQQTIQEKITQICSTLNNNAQEQYKNCYKAFKDFKEKVAQQSQICEKLKSLFMPIRSFIDEKQLSEQSKVFLHSELACDSKAYIQGHQREIIEQVESTPPPITSEKIVDVCSESVGDVVVSSKCVNNTDKINFCKQTIKAWNTSCPSRYWSIFKKCAESLQILNRQLDSYQSYTQAMKGKLLKIIEEQTSQLATYEGLNTTLAELNNPS